MSQKYTANSVKGNGGGGFDSWLAPIPHPAPVLIFLLQVGRGVAEKGRVSDICHS